MNFFKKLFGLKQKEETEWEDVKRSLNNNNDYKNNPPNSVSSIKETNEMNIFDVLKEGNIEKARLIIEKGTEIDVVDSGGNTALIKASMEGNIEFVKLLADNGANLDIKSKDFPKHNSLMWAAYYGHIKIVQLLLEKGANPNLGNYISQTALHLATSEGQTEVVRLMIENGANLDLMDKDEITALMVAAVENKIEIAKMLIENGANLDLKSKLIGLTALGFAERDGHEEIAKMLTEKGLKDTGEKKSVEDIAISVTEKHRSDLVKDIIEKNNKKDKEITGESLKETVTDIDGNVYTPIKIVNQVWTVENLRTTRYNDGTLIPLVMDKKEWKDLTTPAHCWYDNDESNKTKCGALYNLYAVKTGKLAPKGWHVPSDEEWSILVEYLIANGYNWDRTTKENKIAKSLAAKVDWKEGLSPGEVGYRLNKNNKSGFSALPCGYRDGHRDHAEDFVSIGSCGHWWSAKEDDVLYTYTRYLSARYDNLSKHRAKWSYGLSVRLLQD